MRPATPLLAASAVCSGFAALALELLWGRELALTFGASQHAAAAVLTAFMLGLAVGSGAGGRLADRVRRPARTLALIELCLALVGPALSALLLALPAASAALLPGVDAARLHFIAGRLGLGTLLMLPATALMGATFPLLTRAAATTLPAFHRGLGVLYAANTLGGVVGAAAAGLLLLPRWGVPGVAAAAAAANLLASILAVSADRPRAEERAPRPVHVPLPLPLLTAAALSGALVLGAETLWHRALSVVLASSTASLTTLLAVTLAGLGLGGAAAPALLRRVRPLAGWGVLQLSAAVLLVAEAVLLPQLSLLVRVTRPADGWARVLLPPLLTGSALVLPVALLLGMAWPLLLAAATPLVDDGGRRVGTMGLVNSLGAALGATGASFALLPAFGFGRSLLLLAALQLGLAFVALRQLRPRTATAAAVLSAAVLLAAAFAPRFGRVLLPSMVGPGAGTTAVLAYQESPAGTVVVSEESFGRVRSMYVDSNVVIGTSQDALKAVRVLGLAPLLFHPRPREALVIGFGAGVTTATVAGCPEVERIEVAEIVPAVAASARFFSTLNHDVLADPRVHLALNDGRNHLLLSQRRYDVITCDPVHPLYGSAPLYSLDFFRLCRDRLAPGGVVCQYLPLHRMPSEELRRAVATFQAAFPETRLLFTLGHAALVGSERPLDLDWELWQRRLAGHRLLADLADSALDRPAQVAALLELDPDGCRAIGAGAPSTDLHPWLEFLAPRAYLPGLWEANARLLVEAYRSPFPSIRNLPAGLEPDLRRLVAGKRLLLFAQLERSKGDLAAATGWLRRALEVAGDDPEVGMYARNLQAER